MKTINNIKVDITLNFCIKLRVMILLYRVWRKYPDLRFFQLINALRYKDHFYEDNYWTTLILKRILKIGLSEFLKEVRND